MSLEIQMKVGLEFREQSVIRGRAARNIYLTAGVLGKISWNLRLRCEDWVKVVKQ